MRWLKRIKKARTSGALNASEFPELPELLEVPEGAQSLDMPLSPSPHSRKPLASLAQHLHKLLQPQSRNGSNKQLPITGVYCQSGAREAWWPLSQDMMLSDTQPQQEPQEGVFLSFAPQDEHSVFLGKKRPQAIERELISDLGENVFTVKHQFGTASGSSDGDSMAQPLSQPWLYATTQARLDALPKKTQIISGIAAIRGLLATSNALHTLQAPFVTGVLFDGPAVQVLILMVCSESGELTQMDYVPLAGLQPQAAIRSYVQSVRLSASGEWTQERTAIFMGQELSRLSLKPYPREAELFGTPASQLWRSCAQLSAGALVLSAGALTALIVMNKTQALSVEQSLQDVQKSKQALVSAIAENHLGALLERRSVSIDKAITNAQALWQDGARVSLKATPELLTLTVAHKVQNPEQSPQALATALSMQLPAGCMRLPPAVTPQMTELYLTYECQTPDPDLQRLGLAAQ